jgi:hypothetical protein
MICGDRVRDFLKKDGFSRFRRRDDQGALAFAYRTEKVNNPRRYFLCLCFEIEPLVRVEGGEILEGDAILSDCGFVEIDLLDAEHREEALAFFGTSNLAVDRISGLQVEKPYLTGANINIVRTREGGILRRSEETVAVGQYLKRSVGVNNAAPVRMRLQNIENEFLFFEGNHLLVIYPIPSAEIAEFFQAHVGQIIDR